MNFEQAAVLEDVRCLSDEGDELKSRAPGHKAGC